MSRATKIPYLDTKFQTPASPPVVVPAAPSPHIPLAAGMPLREILESIEGRTIDPELRFNGPVTPAAAGAHAAHMKRLGSLTPAIVIQAGRSAIEFHRNAEAEALAERDAIRDGQRRYNNNAFVENEKTQLAAHHRQERERIQAQIDALVAA